MAGWSARRRRPGHEPARRNPPEQRPLRRAGRYAMSNFLQDLRYGLRMLAKSPGFTLVAVLALGLGIGANTAIFSVFNGMLWRPMAVQNPQQIVSVTAKVRGLDFPGPLSYPDFQDYRQLQAVFSDLVAFSPSPVNFEADGR